MIIKFKNFTEGLGIPYDSDMEKYKEEKYGEHINKEIVIDASKDKIPPEEVAYLLIRDCKPIIKELRKLKNKIIPLKGLNNVYYNYAKCKSQLDYRPPLDMWGWHHDIFNDVFEGLFGWKVRNGVLTYMCPSNKHTTGYGDNDYIFLPIGDYDYVYSTDISDLFSEVEDGYMNVEDEDELRGLIEHGDFTDDNLNYFDRDDHIKGRSEISWGCKEYYLFDEETYRDVIEKIIWR